MTFLAALANGQIAEDQPTEVRTTATVERFQVVVGRVPTKPRPETETRPQQQIRLWLKPESNATFKPTSALLTFTNQSGTQTHAGVYRPDSERLDIILGHDSIPLVLHSLELGNPQVTFDLGDELPTGERKVRLFLISKSSAKSTTGSPEFEDFRDPKEILKVFCTVENVSNEAAKVCHSGGYAGCQTIPPGKSVRFRIDYGKHIWLDSPGGSRQFRVEDQLFGERYEVYRRNGKLDMRYIGMEK